MRRWAKMAFLCCIFATLIFPCQVYAEPQINKENFKNAFISSLGPAINNALAGHYGKLKQFSLYEAKIINLDKKREGGYFCTIEVVTFEGPHIPPYGYDRITLDISVGGVFVTKFEHRDQPFESR